jgi:hypothetical protein
MCISNVIKSLNYWTTWLSDLASASRNAQQHDPFDIEWNIDGKRCAPGVDRICDNCTGSRRKFTVDSIKLVYVRYKLKEALGILLCIINRDFADHQSGI